MKMLSLRDELLVMEYLNNRDKNKKDLENKKKVSGKLTNSFIPYKRSHTNNEIISKKYKKSSRWLYGKAIY